MPGGSNTTTQKNEPWKDAKPVLQMGLKGISDWYKNPGMGYYPGQTVAGFSPDQNTAFGMTRNMAMGKDPFMAKANKFNMDVLSGKYLQTPGNDAVFTSIQNKVMPSVNSSFSAAGRYGSGAQSNALGQGMTDAYAPFAAQQYQQGLDRMGQAGQALQDNRWRSVAALDAIGRQQQQVGQQQLDARQDRWNYYRDYQINKLRDLFGLASGTGGSSSTTTQPGASFFQKLLGGGLGLAGLLF